MTPPVRVAASTWSWRKATFSWSRSAAIGSLTPRGSFLDPGSAGESCRPPCQTSAASLSSRPAASLSLTCSQYQPPTRTTAIRRECLAITVEQYTRRLCCSNCCSIFEQQRGEEAAVCSSLARLRGAVSHLLALSHANFLILLQHLIL